MCASFIIKTRPGLHDLVTDVRLDIEEYFDKLIVPYTFAPAIIEEDGVIVMKPMKFSLIPSWSKEPKPKFATHNARIESIVEKPTWRDAFQKRHCLIPLTDFVEPIYRNEYAGYMVAFHQKSREPLYAAGIWEEWTNKMTGEIVESFSIVTGEPPKFINEIGHDRCPVFLNDGAQEKWLTLKTEPAKMVAFLNDNRLDADFNIEKNRPMKSGWEKRRK